MEEQSENIAVTHFGHVEFLFALGIKPVSGTSLENIEEWDTFDSWKEELKTIEDMVDIIQFIRKTRRLGNRFNYSLYCWR